MSSNYIVVLICVDVDKTGCFMYAIAAQNVSVLIISGTQCIYKIKRVAFVSSVHIVSYAIAIE